MSLRVVVVGAGGRLGRTVCDEFARSGHDVIALSRRDLEITDASAVELIVGRTAPQALINCAAYNAVDAAENDTARAFGVNAVAVGLLARAAHTVGASFVHYGTDFIFDGTSPTPYTEDDRVNPLSAYGSSKLAGEVEVRRSIERHFILRVASLFGGVGVHHHRATIDAIADMLSSGKPVRALVDRTVTPSHVNDVARVTRQLVERDAQHGTYHCVSSGFTTWYDLARHLAVTLGVSTPLEPVSVADMKGVARRPQYCALSNDKLRAAGINIPDWKDTIVQHLSDNAGRASLAAL